MNSLSRELFISDLQWNISSTCTWFCSAPKLTCNPWQHQPLTGEKCSSAFLYFIFFGGGGVREADVKSVVFDGDFIRYI